MIPANEAPCDASHRGDIRRVEGECPVCLVPQQILGQREELLKGEGLG